LKEKARWESFERERRDGVGVGLFLGFRGGFL
jgi:hypothetical protein